MGLLCNVNLLLSEKILHERYYELQFKKLKEIINRHEVLVNKCLSLDKFDYSYYLAEVLDKTINESYINEEWLINKCIRNDELGLKDLE